MLTLIYFTWLKIIHVSCACWQNCQYSHKHIYIAFYSLTLPHSAITDFSPHQSNPRFTTNALILTNLPKEMGNVKLLTRQPTRFSPIERSDRPVHCKGPTQSFASRTSLIMYTTRSRNKALKYIEGNKDVWHCGGKKVNRVQNNNSP